MKLHIRFEYEEPNQADVEKTYEGDDAQRIA
jgi:hypothetical protein